MKTLARISAVAAIGFSGAIFGFFYAWICSTMWGLDAAPPDVAIQAMQAMNASVRNATFAPIFFATPLVIAVAAVFAWQNSAPKAAMYFALASLLYLCGGLVLTMVVNVPMNDALANQIVPDDPQKAQDIWHAYSPRWQRFNILRTIASGMTLLLCSLGLMALVQTTETRRA